MGLFNYNNPLIVFMVKVANMLIVSLYWVICCLPVVTILPACAALYHSVNKVINGNGNAVTRDFFTSFRDALRPGVLLTVIVLLAGGLIAFGIYTGTRIWDAGVFGAIYMAVGALIGLLCLSTLVYIAPTLSRFNGNAGVILRLSMYFALRNQLRAIWYAVLLAGAIWIVEFFPLFLLVAPAVYADLIRGGTEKLMTAYIQMAGLEETEEAGEAQPEAEAEALSAKEMDAMLSRETEYDGN
jgi:uncharacterized membrane protein YesL